MEIEHLRQLDGATIGGLVAESQAEGLRFVARLQHGFEAGTKRFDHDGEFVLAAYQEGRLIGLVGVHLDPYADDPAVGRIHHLYVSPEARRSGTGRALLDTLVATAGGRYQVVTLRAIDEAAARFYTNAGFTRDERYPQTSHWRETGSDVSLGAKRHQAP